MRDRCSGGISRHSVSLENQLAPRASVVKRRHRSNQTKATPNRPLAGGPNSTDVPNLPEQYRYVITDGAMYYVYQFRGDLQAAQLSLAKFEQGIKQLRSLHINRTEYLRDTRVHY